MVCRFFYGKGIDQLLPSPNPLNLTLSPMDGNPKNKLQVFQAEHYRLKSCSSFRSRPRGIYNCNNRKVSTLASSWYKEIRYFKNGQISSQSWPWFKHGIDLLGRTDINWSIGIKIWFFCIDPTKLWMFPLLLRKVKRGP